MFKQLLLPLLTVCAIGVWWSSPSSAVAAEEPPRLVVLVVFDQLRGDYLSRWEDLYGKKGFRRLMDEGAWFTNCHYPYALTLTGAGHASFLTGCSGNKNGIVSNEWYDVKKKEEVNCAEHGDFQRVPALPRSDTPPKRKPYSVSPENLRAQTLGEVLKKQHKEAKVVAVALKDRSAVLPGGMRPDGCYWFDTVDGQFVTSSFYQPQLPGWVMKFNQSQYVDRWFGKDWVRLKPELNYDRYSGPDDGAGEGIGVAQGRTFPHPTNGDLKKPGQAYYEALTNTPFGNDLLLEFTRKAIESEKLGADEVPDLLSISFSSNDLIGHTWGPDSHEVLDVTLRSDLIVEELLRLLDDKVGKGKYVLALTSDHGVCPMPEALRRQKKEGGRILQRLFVEVANQFVQETFGDETDKERWVLDGMNGWITLNEPLIKERKLDLTTVEKAVVKWANKQYEIQSVYTKDDVTGNKKGDELLDRIRLSYQADRCGHVIVIFRPYFYTWRSLTGTTHGSPHPYDTHVPLLVYGAGVQKGKRNELVTPQSIAAILAKPLGIKPPEKAEHGVPEKLFAEKK